MLNVTTKIDKEAAIEEVRILMQAVADIRAYFGFTRQTFALLCDVPVHSYRVLERHGKGDLVTFHKVFTVLAKKLSIDVNYLLSNQSYPPYLFKKEHLEIKENLHKEMELSLQTSSEEKTQIDNLLRNDVIL